MELKFENCSIFNQKEIVFKNGVNFYISNDNFFQKRMHHFLNNKVLENERFFIDDSAVSLKDIRKNTYFINLKEKSFFLKNRKFKSMIDTNSKIIELLDIQSAVFDLRFKQLWHWSYLCSCAIGINKGKNILFFPWINAKECSIQSYRINKLFEYSQQNDLIIIIPTDSIEIFENNLIEGMGYSIYEESHL